MDARRTLFSVLLLPALASCGDGATTNAQAPATAIAAPPALAGRAPGPSEGRSPDGVEVAGWELGATRVESSNDAWGGPRPSFGGDGLPLSQRVTSYKMTVTLDPDKHTVDGGEVVSWTNRADVPIRSVYAHLYLNAFEGPGSTFLTEKDRYGAFRSDVETKAGEWGYTDLSRVEQGGRAVPWTYVHPDGGPSTDHTVVRLDLPEAVAPGATTQLTIDFHDQLPRVVARTGYFDKYHLVAQWFPKLGVLEIPGERGATAPRWNCHELHLNSEFYADFGSYDVEVIAPPTYLVRATGVLSGEPQKVAGGLSHHFLEDDVHDFVFTAWNQYAKPLVGTYDGPGSPHVTIEVLHPAEYAESAEAALLGTKDALAYFSRTLGPYPYRHVTVVVPPHNAIESGGMEYETFFTTVGGKGIIHDFTRYVTVHEFGHGYFMGLLASNEFEEPFLDEGMNETWDARMLEKEGLTIHPPPWLRALGFRAPTLDYYDFESTGTRRHQADPIAGSSWDRFSSDSYRLVYARTVMVFHDLEAQLGRADFERGMKLYYARWHHRHPGTADLRAALAEGSGKPELVNRWFEEQVYANTPIDDRVTMVESHELVPRAGVVVRDGKRVEQSEADVQRQIEEARAAFTKAHPGVTTSGPYPFENVVVARRFAGQVPQTLRVTLEDGTEETLSWPPGERWRRFVLERSSRVVSAELDPARSIRLDVDKLDDGRSRMTSQKAPMRVALDVSTFVSLALSLLVTP